MLLIMKVWADAAKSGGAAVDQGFVNELVRMGQAAGQSRGGTAFLLLRVLFCICLISVCWLGAGNAMHNDSQTSHNGVFSSTLRLQPRFEKGKAQMYDQIVKQKQREEEDKRKRRMDQAEQIRAKAEEEDRLLQEKAKQQLSPAASAVAPVADVAAPEFAPDVVPPPFYSSYSVLPFSSLASLSTLHSYHPHPELWWRRDSGARRRQLIRHDEGWFRW